jgi:CRISPR-associated endonuclease/helicase Cas3
VFFAHSSERQDRSDWQLLKEHLERVAARAGSNAAKFGTAEWGRIAGLLHDLGKYSPEFQTERLEKVDGRRVDHSTAGAKIATERYGSIGRLLAFCIAGHHAGLADGVNGEKLASLTDRLGADFGKRIPQLDHVWRVEVPLPDSLPLPQLCVRDNERRGFQLAFFARMLFSCLVDADRRDTADYYNRLEGKDSSPPRHPSFNELRARLDAYLLGIAARAVGEPDPGRRVINENRALILSHVRTGAKQPRGLFSLTVPTGGGKTLTSLAFALDHAIEHGLDRIIYVIPFTSIIEQNAQVFRDALDDLSDAVLEHHSAFDWEEKLKSAADADTWDGDRELRLAMESWDKPIVVTTAVQFFESLFSNRTSKCRKLHNIAKSVVILDEAQKLPYPLLRPCVAALDELARNYGTTIILCTATQPAITENPNDPAKSFEGGLQDVRELAPDPQKLYEDFQRVTIVKEPNPLNDAELAERLKAERQVLCIVDNRKQARAIYELIKDVEGARHLTTLMYAKHRSDVLREIKQDLENGEPCRLVATSLIEAGVDVDFPTVYRATAGIDSIAQAAGRCNREGRRSRPESRVIVFESQQRQAPNDVEQFAAAGQSVMRHHDDPLSLPAVDDYFREVYWLKEQGSYSELDSPDRDHLPRGILGACSERTDSLDFPFETIGAAFRLIKDFMVPIIVPREENARDALQALEHAERVGTFARKLQPYIVQVPPKARAHLISVGAASVIQSERFDEQFVRLDNLDLYDPNVGLRWDDPTFVLSESLLF